MVTGSARIDLWATPGHLLRRAQQLHTEQWRRLVRDLTGPQYAALVAVDALGEADHTTVGDLASLDRTTVGAVVARLRTAGLLEQRRDGADGRRRVLRLTGRASSRLPELSRAVGAVQQLLMSPIPVADRTRFLDSLAAAARIRQSGLLKLGAEGLTMLAGTPGHLLRRAQQVHAAAWAELVGDVTSPQFAVLVAAAGERTASHAEIGLVASLDSSSTLDVVRRLTGQGWLEQVPSAADRRCRPVRVPVSRRGRLQALYPAVEQVQQRVLDPLTPEQQAALVAGLRRIATMGHDVGAAPKPTSDRVLRQRTRPSS